MTLTALQEALYTYEHRDTLDKQALTDAAISLGEWGLFSCASIVKITGLPRQRVQALLQKSDKTGGRFDPEDLPHLIDLSIANTRGEMNVFAAKRATRGTSTYFAARLTGVPRSTLLRWTEIAERFE